MAPLLPIAHGLDLRQAWLALALARLRQNLPDAAAHHLIEALDRHALDDDDGGASAGIADAVARAVGAAGYCGLTADGAVRVCAFDRAVPLLVVAGGQVLATGVAVPDRPFTARLPSGWERLEGVTVRAEAGRLLASALRPALLAETEGLVEDDGAGGLAGWAWRRRAPAHAPVLTLRDEAGRACRIVPTELALEPVIPDRTFGTIARGFRVAAVDCPRGVTLEVLDEAGRPLAGSPIEPGLVERAVRGRALGGRRGAADAARFAPVPASFVGPAPQATPAPAAPVAIVIPVHGDRVRTLGCLDAVFATVPGPTAVHVVDDATPDRALADALDRLADAGRITLHRHPDGRNHGFPASANLGMARAGAADVVLLNSDTVPVGDWLGRLGRAVYAATDIATATPFTNEGSILAYPRPCASNAMPSPEAAGRLGAIAAAVNHGVAVEIPTANGFCMFIRRAALDAVGPFRTDLWGRGYGEENDFSMRCRHRGWRHVAVADAFVAHAGGASFRTGRLALARRNGAILEQLHPGYDALVAAFIAADPLAPARRRLDAARFDAALAENGDGPVALFVTHTAGGGVERFVRGRFARARERGERVLVLRPDPEGLRTDLACLDDGDAGRRFDDQGRFPNLRWQLPAEADALDAALRALGPARIELHHLLGHAQALPGLLRGLGAPIDVWLHDYGWYCHQVGLFGPEDRYCGEPDRAGCRRCVAELGSRVAPERPDVDALLDGSAALLGAARTVTAPSEAVAGRFRAHFPALAAPAIVPWERDPPGPAPRPAWPGAAVRPLRVAVPGGLGPEKGYAVVLGCARDARARALPLGFTVVGHSADDDRLLAVGVDVTGPYEPDEATSLLRGSGADLGFVASSWPETWCYTLGECWEAGLPVAVFDLGTQGERVRRRGGLLLPLGLPPDAINDRLLDWAVAGAGPRDAAGARLRHGAAQRTTGAERPRATRLSGTLSEPSGPGVVLRNSGKTASDGG